MGGMHAVLDVRNKLERISGLMGERIRLVRFKFDEGCHQIGSDSKD